jgi:serine/threonine protein kinase
MSGPNHVVLKPGQVVDGTYTVERVLGRPSGMGQVFAARELALNRVVAIKIPSLEILLAPDGPRRFFREAELSAAMEHPNIVKIHVCRDVHQDAALRINVVGRTIPIPFIVMEYLGGGDLGERLTPEGMTFDQVAVYFSEMCAGVEYAHAFEYSVNHHAVRGIIHRDLKPQNICFDRRNRLVIVDFGIARLIQAPSTSGGILGTPAYMAPEQWRPSESVDGRADQYALAVILYQMLTGSLPFRADEFAQWMAAHLGQVPPDVREQRPQVPAPVAEAIGRAMAKRKEDRFASVAELRRVVARGFEGNRAVRARKHLLRGDQLARAGRYDDAIAEYGQAIMLNPTEVNAVINRGYCWYRQGLLEEALTEYTHAIKIDPVHPDAYNNRGMVLKELGAFESAIQDFRQTLELDPAHPLAPNNLKDAIQRMERGKQ